MRNEHCDNLPQILSVGTKIVTKIETRPIGGGPRCPAGIVGIVVSSPSDNDHAYRVRFANGAESSVKRDEMEMLVKYQHQGIEQLRGAVEEHGLQNNVIYRCVVGSRAYGLDHDESDTDRRGIYIAPCDMYWSLYGAPEQLENEATQECYWEIQKFIVLALKANPNILECLYTPLIEHATPTAQILLDMREIFLSKLVYQTYNGYVMSQFKKINSDRRNSGNVKPKHAMHLIRLLMSGIGVLKDGLVPVEVKEHRDNLLAIRNGDMSWEHVDAWRLRLHNEFDEALAHSTLPDRPDYERANDFLIKVRRENVLNESNQGRQQ